MNNNVTNDDDEGKYLDSFSTHSVDSNIIYDLVRRAYENEKQNLPRKGQGAIGSGTNKKSPQQNGASSAACLLLYLQFESALRIKHYRTLTDDHKQNAYKGELSDIYSGFGQRIKDESLAKRYFDDLTLLRNIITHVYLYKTRITYDEQKRITAIEETAIGGRHANKAQERLSPTLGLHLGPNQIGFCDVAIYYLATYFLLKNVGLSFNPDPWPWKNEQGKTEKWIPEPTEWFLKAMRELGYDKKVIWRKLQQNIQEFKHVDGLARLAAIYILKNLKF